MKTATSGCLIGNKTNLVLSLTNRGSGNILPVFSKRLNSVISGTSPGSNVLIFKLKSIVGKSESSMLLEWVEVGVAVASVEVMVVQEQRAGQGAGGGGRGGKEEKE